MEHHGAGFNYAVSTIAVPFNGARDGRVRATHDVDNGARGRDIKFYTSTDGVTWTQLGATITTAGAITRYASPSTDLLTLGCMESSNPSRTWMGRIYYVQILNGINRHDVAPNLPDLWRQVTLYSSLESRDSPTLTIYNASVAGQNS